MISTNPSHNIPPDVLLQIFSYLKPSSLLSCMLTCHDFYNAIDSKLWRLLSLRDYHPFLYQIPLTFDQVNTPDFKTRIETLEEAEMCFVKPSNRLLSESELKRLEAKKAAITNWKEFYQKCHKLEPWNLSGFWIGDYESHGFELIRIYHHGYEIYAQKLTGDPNIPAPKLTWKMTMDKDMKKGKGEIHLAETGYINSRWNTAYIDGTSPNVIKITWVSGTYLGYLCCITFANVKIGKAEFDPDSMGRKVEMVPRVLFQKANNENGE